MRIISYQFMLIRNILTIAAPIGISTFIGLIALLINYHILAESNIHYLYWLALYAPFNYYLIALYESLKAASVFAASSEVIEENTDKLLGLMFSLFIIACIFIVLSSILFYFACYFFGFLHADSGFCYFCSGMIFSSLFVCWFYIITSFYYGLQYKNLSMMMSLLAAILHCAITYILVKKFQWGISSYVLSNIFSYGIIGVWSISHFAKCNHFYLNAFYIHCSDIWHALRLLKSIALPVWSSYFLIFVSLGLINHLLADFGQIIVSAYGLAYRIQSIILFPAISLGTALSILVNQYYIKHKFILAADTLTAGIFLSTFLYSGLALFCFSYKNFLMQCVTDNFIIVSAGAEYFKYCALSYSVFGTVIMYGVFLEQTGFGIRNLCIQSLYFFILALSGWYLTQVLGNYHYFYYSIALDNYIIFLLMGLMFCLLGHDKKRHDVICKNKQFL